MKIELYNNECLEKIKELPDNSVDCIVTDPPYFISFMNKEWDKEDSVASKKEFWKECLRVTKAGGYLLAFGHTRTHHRLYTAIEDSGWEIRDTIMWLHGQGFPKSKNLGDGWGTALKPAVEPICMARKPFDGSVEKVFKETGLGGINIDASRIETTESFDNVKGRPIHKLTNGGKVENLNNEAQQKALEKLKTLGRFPANVIIDEEVGAILDKQSKDVSRFFYCAKVSSKERNAGCKSLDKKVRKRVNSGGLENDPKWKPTLQENNHPTVKPIALMEYLIKLVSKEEHTILDPFMGSGSTGIAAKRLNRNFIGIELDAKYYTIAKTRIGELEDASS